MSGSFDTRTRRTVVVATGVAALAVGVLATLPAAPAATVAAEATTTTASTSSGARASSALTRSLVAQSRAARTADAAATRVAQQASRSAAKAAAKPAAAAIAWTAPKRSNGLIDWTRMPVLEPGVTHPAVRYLQARIGVKRTGYYGPMTLALVTQAQEAAGLPAEGYVGPRTWELIYQPRTSAAPQAAAAASSSGGSSSGSSSSRTSSAPSVGGRVCPAPGSAFGSGWGAPRGGRSHMGVDLMGSRGSAIVAIEDGYIVRAGRQSNGALRIVMQGVSGSKFYYGHQDAHYVSAGQRVKRGQVIGAMGDTGSPGAVHLHFEYWKSGGESAAVDPYPLLASLCW
jgi:murein DD-endopeptidase MepM/ murein hydrolase activator NlpD